MVLFTLSEPALACLTLRFSLTSSISRLRGEGNIGTLGRALSSKDLQNSSS